MFVCSICDYLNSWQVGSILCLLVTRILFDVCVLIGERAKRARHYQG